MEVPALTTVEGAYWYLIGLIALLALVSAGYVLGVVLGLLPDPAGLFSLVPAGVS